MENRAHPESVGQFDGKRGYRILRAAHTLASQTAGYGANRGNEYSGDHYRLGHASSSGVILTFLDEIDPLLASRHTDYELTVQRSGFVSGKRLLMEEQRCIGENDIPDNVARDLLSLHAARAVKDIGDAARARALSLVNDYVRVVKKK